MSATKQAKLSWKAVRRGDIYCAPACGGGCTFAAYELAKWRATHLAQRLGPTWEIRLNENLGWHYSVKSPCGRINVNEYWSRPKTDGIVDQLATILPESYMAFLNLNGKSGGRWTCAADTPEEAIREVIAMATGERDEIATMLEGVKPSLDELVD